MTPRNSCSKLVECSDGPAKWTQKYVTTMEQTDERQINQDTIREHQTLLKHAFFTNVFTISAVES